MTFSDAADDYLLGASEASRPIYARRLREHVLPMLGRLPVERITREDVQGVLSEVSPGSRHAVRAVVRAVLRYAGNHEADGLKIRGGRAHEPRPLSRAESDRLLGVLGDQPADTLLAVLLATGLRLGEAMALRRSDWIEDRRVLRVKAAKAARGREVGVPEWAVPQVERLLAGECPVERTVRRVLARRLRAAGLPEVRIHDLRHTRAAQLLLAGAPVRYVSEQLGHSTVAFTLQVYGALVGDTPQARRAWANL